MNPFFWRRVAQLNEDRLKRLQWHTERKMEAVKVGDDPAERVESPGQQG
jgi:hypothetical protein